MVTTRGATRGQTAATTTNGKTSDKKTTMSGAVAAGTTGKKKRDSPEGAGEGETERDSAPAEKKSKTSTTPKKKGVAKGATPKKKETRKEKDKTSDVHVDGVSKKEKQPTVEDETDIEDKKTQQERAVKTKEQNKTDGDTEMKDAVTTSEDRSVAVEESPILEKGLVYFFLRGKVNIENPENMNEVKRSYMVLRPLSPGAELKDGKVNDQGNNRLIAIPKKKLPVRGYERFLTFVEEPKASMDDLKNKYLKERSYQTKTAGDRTDFAAQPVGEGVYAITKSDNERQSHFAYMLTTPQDINELQQEFGLREKGSFIISVRNPNTPAPSNTSIPDPAEYPKEIMDDFRGLKWGPVEPRHLDYKNSEILFIGEKQFPESDEHKGTADELHQLEEEDEKRVAHLKGTEVVFADLELSSQEYKGIKTTWG